MVPIGRNNTWCTRWCIPIFIHPWCTYRVVRVTSWEVHPAKWWWWILDRNLTIRDLHRQPQVSDQGGRRNHSGHHSVPHKNRIPMAGPAHPNHLDVGPNQKIFLETATILSVLDRHLLVSHLCLVVAAKVRIMVQSILLPWLDQLLKLQRQ